MLGVSYLIIIVRRYHMSCKHIWAVAINYLRNYWIHMCNGFFPKILLHRYNVLLGEINIYS